MLNALRNTPDSMSMEGLKECVDPNLMNLYPHDCLYKIRSRRLRMTEENQALQCQLLLKKELDSLRMGEEWDDSTQTKEQIEASIVSKQEATIRRERAMAYAFSHQWKNSSRTANPMFIDPSNPQWGWSWLERWMAAKPWENRGTEKDPKDTNSVKSSATATVTPIPVLGEGEITKSDGKLLIPDGKLLRNKRSHQLLPGATHFRRIMAPMTSDPLSGLYIALSGGSSEIICLQRKFGQWKEDDVSAEQWMAHC